MEFSQEELKELLIQFKIHKDPEFDENFTLVFNFKANKDNVLSFISNSKKIDFLILKTSSWVSTTELQMKR